MNSIPTMRAVLAYPPGGVDALTFHTRDLPVPQADEVLIKVDAAGINRPDILQREGKYPLPDNASDILGLEVAGIITAVGENVTRWMVGDAVCALTNGGGYADYVTVPAGQCLPVPDGWTMPNAAALPETFFTVWFNVFAQGQLKKGEHLLVHGGSSGIGCAAIQMAKAWGATVSVTVGTDEKADFCKKLGADIMVNYKKNDFTQHIKSVDVVLDMVGGDYISRNLSIMNKQGRHISIAFLNGRQASIDVATVMRRQLTLTGSTLRTQSNATKAVIADELKSHIWPFLERGIIQPAVTAAFPFDEVRQAHTWLEEGNTMGKAVLIMLDA